MKLSLWHDLKRKWDLNFKNYIMETVSIARICHEANRAYCVGLGDNSQTDWDNAPDWQKESAVNGVKFHLENLNSKPEDSHNNWLKEKEADGWKFGEVKNEETKEHPCIVPYSELSEDEQKKDALFIAIVHAFTKTKQEQPEQLKMKRYEFRAVIDRGLKHPVFEAQSEKAARKKAEKEHPGIQIITCRKI